MPRRFIKRYMPKDQTVRDHKHMRHFGTLLRNPNLWHLNRRSVSGGVSTGLFVAFIPLPMQMILAAAIAIGSRVNLPIAVVVVWISNPITIPPMFYASYKTGAWLLGSEIRHVGFEFSLEWVMSELVAIWQPFLLGCLVLGTASALAGNILVRLLWRLHVLRYIRRKRAERAVKKQSS